MKKRYCISVFLSFLFSCAYNNYQNPWDFELQLTNRNDNAVHSYLISPYNNVKDKFTTIFRYVAPKDGEIKYGNTGTDYIPFPQNVIDEKKGECQGKSILIIGMLYKYLNIKCDYVEAFFPENKRTHAFILYNNQYYDSTSMNKMKKNRFIIIKIIKFNDLSFYINNQI
jgi:hypothetical protein